MYNTKNIGAEYILYDGLRTSYVDWDEQVILFHKTTIKSTQFRISVQQDRKHSKGAHKF